jgi:hypothetical protein
MANTFANLTNIAQSSSSSLSSVTGTAIVDNTDVVRAAPIPTLREWKNIVSVAFNLPQTDDTLEGVLALLTREQYAAVMSDIGYYISKNLAASSTQLTDQEVTVLAGFIRRGITLREYITSGQKIVSFSYGDALAVVHAYLKAEHSAGSVFDAVGSNLLLSDDEVLRTESFTELFKSAVTHISMNVPDSPLRGMINFSISGMVTFGLFSSNQFLFLVPPMSDMEKFISKFESEKRNHPSLTVPDFFSSEHGSNFSSYLPSVVSDRDLDDLVSMITPTNISVGKELRWADLSKFSIKDLLSGIRNSRLTPSMANGANSIVDTAVTKLLRANPEFLYLGKFMKGSVNESPARIEDVKARVVVIHPTFSTGTKESVESVVDKLVSSGNVVLWFTRLAVYSGSEIGTVYYKQIHPLMDIFVIACAGTCDPRSTNHVTLTPQIVCDHLIEITYRFFHVYNTLIEMYCAQNALQIDEVYSVVFDGCTSPFDLENDMDLITGTAVQDVPDFGWEFIPKAIKVIKESATFTFSSGGDTDTDAIKMLIDIL